MADGYLDLEDDDDWDQSDDELRKQEGNRLARVNMKAARDSTRPKDPPSSAHLITNQELHGEWSGVTIDTSEDYDRLSSAAHRGDEFALGYIHYLNSKHQVPSAVRSPGVTRLVKHYASFAKGPHQAAMERYKARLTRYRRQQDRLNNAAPAIPERVPLSEGVHELGDIKSYELMSPTYHQGDLPQLPAPIDDMRDSTTNNGMSNPRDPHQSVGREWAQVPVHSWPRGMRIHEEGRDPRVPTDADMNSYLTPCLADIQAIRYLAELSPARRHRDASTKLARKTWQHLFRDLFSIPGLYAHIIGSTRFPLGNRRRERFPFDTRNMDIIHVAVWAHDHGLDPQSPAVREIEDWAARVRNEVDGRHPDGSWSSSPSTITEIAGVYQRQLSEINTMFQYPPRAQSVHPRSWATSAEIYVDQQRDTYNLARILVGVLIDEEDPNAEAPMHVDETASAGPSGEHPPGGG